MGDVSELIIVINVAHFEVLSLYLRGGTEKKKQNSP
jgi:hypothetical protein